MLGYNFCLGDKLRTVLVRVRFKFCDELLSIMLFADNCKVVSSFVGTNNSEVFFETFEESFNGFVNILEVGVGVEVLEVFILVGSTVSLISHFACFASWAHIFKRLLKPLGSD